MTAHRERILIKLLKIHYKSLKTLYARAPGLYFPTSAWAWSWPKGQYQKEPILFFQRASVLNKIPWNSCLQLQNSECQGLLPTPPWAWSLPWGWCQIVPKMFFLRASMLNKIPEIHEYSFKTLNARASALQCIFQHLLEPEACPDSGIKKYQKCFFIEPVSWTKYPKFINTA